MSAQASPAGRVEPPRANPRSDPCRAAQPASCSIRHRVPLGARGSKTTYRLDRLNEVMQAWWQLAWARRSPGHKQALETGHRVLGGEQVETFPVDLDALRP
jgi:hypothetical protein